MGQPVNTEEYEVDAIVLSDWRVDDNGVLASGTNYSKGTVLGKITASGKYTTSLAASNDGSEVPSAILLDDIDASASDLNAPVLLGGKVDENLLTFGTGHDADGTRAVLRDNNIYLATKG